MPGLIAALESKYKISASNIRYLYRKTRLGVNAKIDDDMLRFYTNEDVFLMQVSAQGSWYTGFMIVALCIYRVSHLLMYLVWMT